MPAAETSSGASSRSPFSPEDGQDHDGLQRGLDSVDKSDEYRSEAECGAQRLRQVLLDLALRHLHELEALAHSVMSRSVAKTALRIDADAAGDGGCRIIDCVLIAWRHAVQDPRIRRKSLSRRDASSQPREVGEAVRSFLMRFSLSLSNAASAGSVRGCRGGSRE